MGSSEFTHMYFDLDSLLTSDCDLSWIESPFTKEEIDRIIADLPNYKSPGPNGFNGEFLKKARATISQDFYELCLGFFIRNICMHRA